MNGQILLPAERVGGMLFGVAAIRPDSSWISPDAKTGSARRPFSDPGDPEQDDGARGIIAGVAISLLLWLAIAAAVVLLLQEVGII